VTIEDQILCVEREIVMRNAVYPAFVRRGKYTQAKADHEIKAMKSVLATLNKVKIMRDVVRLGNTDSLASAVEMLTLNQ